MASLFIDCCSPRLSDGQGAYHISNMREFVNQEPPMDMDLGQDEQPMSPRQMDLEEQGFQSPKSSHRSLPRCPMAPRKVSRDLDANDEDDWIIPSTTSFASIPHFPFESESFHRAKSEDSTETAVPRRLFVAPKFSEPIIAEGIPMVSPQVHIIKPDEEREPVNEENQQHKEEDGRQKHDSDSRRA